MHEIINRAVKESIETKSKLLEMPEIEEGARLVVHALRSGKKVLICGNGGSAADAQHFAAELVCKYDKDRPSLPAIALTVDTSNLTAIANDYGYEHVFARQVSGLGNSGDVLIAISTSGKSPNVLKAIDAANEKNITVITLGGKGGGPMKEKKGLHIIIPSNVTARIQECHELILHSWCEMIDKEVFGV